MNLVDNYKKSNINNPTIGIIISKKQDKFVAEYVKSEKLIPITYEFAWYFKKVGQWPTFLKNKKELYALPEYFPSLVEIIIFSPSFINKGTLTI